MSAAYAVANASTRPGFMTARVGEEAYGCVEVSVVLVIPPPRARVIGNFKGLPKSSKFCCATLTVPSGRDWRLTQHIMLDGGRS